jgi:hypothetical protein
MSRRHKCTVNVWSMLLAERGGSTRHLAVSRPPWSERVGARQVPSERTRCLVDVARRAGWIDQTIWVTRPSRARGRSEGDAQVRAVLVTLPARKQPVHTFTRFVAPFTRARTRWMFGFQRRLVRTWLWETLMPNDGFLPQTSHTDAMVVSVLRELSEVIAVAAVWGRTEPGKVSITHPCRRPGPLPNPPFFRQVPKCRAFLRRFEPRISPR